MDGGAWRATVYGVAKSQTRLSDFISLSQVALVVKNQRDFAGDVRDSDLIPGAGRCPGGEHGNPLQYSYLENPRDREAWRATVRGAAESQGELSYFAPRLDRKITD